MRQSCLEKKVSEKYHQELRRQENPKTWLNNITEWTELDVEWAATDLIGKRQFMTDDAVKPLVEDG